MLSGIKNRRDLWKHFHYNEAEKKTQCQVLTEGKKKCGHKILGKNMLNLKRHIATHHKEIKVPHYHPPPLPTHPKGHSPTTRTDRPLLLECETGLPLASLRLLASPLQLTYAYIWQVIQQRDVRQYNRVEEFVATVTQTLPDLLSFEQTAQLLLGLRARIILELLQPQAIPNPKTIQTLINKLNVCHTKKDAEVQQCQNNFMFLVQMLLKNPAQRKQFFKIILELLQPQAIPNPKTIQTLINKLNVCHTKKDAEVQQCQNNFMFLVQMLLKNPAQRKQFFKDVFPVQYGPKFDTALQALIAGLVCKLEQLLPVPNLSKLGSMISTSMEACAQFIPDPSDLTTLLKRQEPKAKPGKDGSTISSNVGDCVLSSLSYIPAGVEPPNSPVGMEFAATSPASPASFSDEDDVGDMSRDSDDDQCWHMCEQCGKMFLTPSELETHMGSHNKELGAMISTSMEACAQFSPDPSDGKTDAVEPPKSPERVETAATTSAASPASCSDTGDMFVMDLSSCSNDHQVTETPTKTPMDRRTRSSNTRSTGPAGPKNQDTEANIAAATLVALTSQEKTQEVSGTKEYTPIQERIETEELQTTPLLRMPPEPREPEQSPTKLIPLKIIPMPIRNASASPNAGSAETSSAQKLQTQRVTLQQWVSQVATRSLSLPALPPVPPLKMRVRRAGPEKQEQIVKKKPNVPVVRKERKEKEMRFACETCNKRFPCPSKLQDHERIHTGEKPYQCTTCLKCFRTKTVLNYHQKSHSDIWPYRCETCDLRFPQQNLLQDHERIHTGEKPYPCTTCEKSFRSEALLNKHQKIHSGIRPYRCQTCDMRFPQQYMLLDHERIHTGETPYACKTCGKRFRAQTLLNKHQKSHSDIRPHRCDQCGKSFRIKSALIKHNVVHSGQKPFYCEICNRGFTQSSYFKRHMEAHTSQKSFACKHCDKTFPTEFKLEVHQRWHVIDRPHMCELCGKRFLKPSELKRHMGYHNAERPYLCSQCGRTFVYMYDLKRHQLYHGPKVKLPCPVCQKKFSIWCLRIHVKTHNNERPYHCDICNKTFKTTDGLKVHKRFHSDERPFSCDVCGKSYKHPSHLSVHKHSHSRTWPWKCDICKKRFTAPGTLKKHMLLHSRETTPGFSNKRRHKSRHKLSLKRKYDDDDDEDY